MFDLQIPNLKEQAVAVVQQAQAIMIWSPEDYQKAEKFLVNCQTALKAIETKRAELKRPIIDQGKQIDEAAKELSFPFEKAKTIAQRACYQYRQEQEAKRREAERKAREEAEAERKRLEAEAAKIQAEAQTAATHGERIMAEAKAIEVKESVQRVATVAEVIEVPKASSAMMVKRSYKCNVVSLGAFVKYIADNFESNPALLNFIKLDLPKMNKFVNATAGSIKFEGVEFLIEEKLSTRAKSAKKDVIEG